MAELFRHDPLGRFTGLADHYARHRPGYPDAALDWLLSHAGLGPQSVLVDVGCGTGISSRLFARRGVPVIGIEPNAEMRLRAEAEPPSAGPVPVYRDGRAEATGLPAASADGVLAAQAFHWFEPDAALREFHRILRPGGWVVLLWNERDESDAFTAAYGEALRAASGADLLERARGEAGDVLLTSPLFHDAMRRSFPNEQVMDQEGLLGRAFSTSYAPREPDRAEAFATGLRQLFSLSQREGKVRLRYTTTVTIARRP